MTAAANHVMIDLETWGRTPDCVVTQVSAVRFELACGGQVLLSEAFNQFCSPASQPGRLIDPDTVVWWGRQPTFAEVCGRLAGARPMGEVALAFRDWMLSSPPDGVWARGPDFDLVILCHLYEGWMQVELPWDFRLHRCQRTFCDPEVPVTSRQLGPLKDWSKVHGGSTHDGLHDCLVQIHAMHRRLAA